MDNPKKGRSALFHQLPDQLQSPVRKTWEASLTVKGAKLFNMIPKELRDMTGTALQFKAGLDKWLSNIPNQPTVNGRQRAAKTYSLLDQVPMHQNTIDYS